MAIQMKSRRMCECLCIRILMCLWYWNNTRCVTIVSTSDEKWAEETWTEMETERKKKRFTMMRTIPLEYMPWNAKINRILNRESNAAHSSFYTPKFTKQPRKIMNRARTGFAQRGNRTSERCIFLPLHFTYCFVFVFTSFIFDDANWLQGKLNTTTGDASHRNHFDTHHQSESDRAAILFLYVAHVQFLCAVGIQCWFHSTANVCTSGWSGSVKSIMFHTVLNNFWHQQFSRVQFIQSIS